jgi:hypothetical protein
VGFISVFGGGDADDILFFYAFIMFFCSFSVSVRTLGCLLAVEVPSRLSPRPPSLSGAAEKVNYPS